MPHHEAGTIFGETDTTRGEDVPPGPTRLAMLPFRYTASPGTLTLRGPSFRLVLPRFWQTTTRPRMKSGSRKRCVRRSTVAFDRTAITTICRLDSKAAVPLQLVDLLVSAVAFEFRQSAGFAKQDSPRASWHRPQGPPDPDRAASAGIAVVRHVPLRRSCVWIIPGAETTSRLHPVTSGITFQTGAPRFGP